MVIRESVDLSEPSATAEAPESFGGGGFTVSFVALRDGFLSVFYGSMQRAGSQYPAGQPTLEVYRDGVLAGTDDVLSHSWPAPSIIQRNCGGLYDEYNYNTTETIDLQIPILTGETISFLFKSDQDTYGDDPGEGGTAPSGNQWAVDIGGFDPSCPFPLELLSFFAEVIECPGLGGGCTVPSVSFIRQPDSTTVSGPDASLRVSTHQTDLDLPASSAYGDSGPDPDTYRLEARGIPAGETVTFEVQTTEAGGAPVNTYTYGAVEGTDGTDVVYRSDQFFRFVSNGIPTVGPDPAATYDDEYAASGATEDPTLLVKLDASVRGAVSDPSGELESVTLPVGISGVPAFTDETILTGSLVFTQIRDIGSSPTINADLATERASEDWAQGRIRFNVGGNTPGVTPVKNILHVSGTATSGGQVKVRGLSGCCFVPVEFFVVIPVNIGDSAQDIAANLASAIMNNNSDFDVTTHVHSPAQGVIDVFVLMDVGLTGWPDNVDITRINESVAGVDVDPANLNFEPLLLTGTDLFEQHSIALNYADNDLTTIDVFAVPSGVFDLGTRAFSWGYLWNPIYEGIENTTFVVEDALNAADAGLPFTFGHELGHILFNGDYTGDDPMNHEPGNPQNLMTDGGTSTTDAWDASKRLTSVQIDDARLDSGPNSPANPKILKNI